MPKRKQASSFRALQLKQLDSKLRSSPDISQPRSGWIRTLREALGMSAAQLAKRLSVTPQGVFDLEKRERDRSITLARLDQAAAALECEVRVILVPKQPLEEVVRRQAEKKARAERDALVHTMRLEAQDDGVDGILDEHAAQEAWLTKRAARLWD